MNGPLSISINTASAKTGIPKFADNSWVHLRCAEVKFDSTEKGHVVKWKWELVDPAASEESAAGTGEPILPGKFGSTYFETVQLYDKNTDPNNPVVPDWAVTKLSVREDALLNTGDADNKKGKDVRPNFDQDLLPTLFGKTCWAQMKIRKGEYEGNEISKMMSEADYAKP